MAELNMASETPFVGHYEPQEELVDDRIVHHAHNPLRHLLKEIGGWIVLFLTQIILFLICDYMFWGYGTFSIGAREQEIVLSPAFLTTFGTFVSLYALRFLWGYSHYNIRPDDLLADEGGWTMGLLDYIHNRPYRHAYAGFCHALFPSRTSEMRTFDPDSGKLTPDEAGTERVVESYYLTLRCPICFPAPSRQRIITCLTTSVALVVYMGGTLAPFPHTAENPPLPTSAKCLAAFYGCIAISVFMDPAWFAFQLRLGDLARLIREEWEILDGCSPETSSSDMYIIDN